MGKTKADKILLKILKILNSKSGGLDIIHGIISFIKNTAGIEAVAIRL